MINNLIFWSTKNEKIIKKWKKKFPRKCFSCSYHKFGYENGMTLDPIPPKHTCLYEKKKEKARS